MAGWRRNDGSAFPLHSLGFGKLDELPFGQRQETGPKDRDDIEREIHSVIKLEIMGEPSRRKDNHIFVGSGSLLPGRAAIN